MLILELDLNLVLPIKTIHKRKYLTNCTFIDNMVNEWGWKIIFQEIFVQVKKVHTYMNCTLIFTDKNKDRNPFCQLHRIYETTLDEFLYLNLDCLFLARIE
jgi:hypothetical protein